MGFRRQGSDGSKRGGAILFGAFFVLFGAFIAYVGHREYGGGGPFFPGLAVAVVGAILIGASVLFPAVDVLRVFGGIVTTILGVGSVGGGLVAGVLGGPRYLPIVPMGLIWLVGAALCFDLPRRLAARGRHREDEVSRILGGSAAVCAGLAIAGQVLTDPTGMSEGVPPWTGVAAGLVFLLAGVLIIAGGHAGFRGPLIVAVFLSLLAALSLALFPPGGIIVAFLAIQGWIVVYRKVHERLTGRDPLAGMSDVRLLGVGCLVFLAVVLLVAAALWLSAPGRSN